MHDINRLIELFLLLIVFSAGLAQGYDSVVELGGSGPPPGVRRLLWILALVCNRTLPIVLYI